MQHKQRWGIPKFSNIEKHNRKLPPKLEHYGQAGSFVLWPLTNYINHFDQIAKFGQTISALFIFEMGIGLSDSFGLLYY